MANDVLSPISMCNKRTIKAERAGMKIQHNISLFYCAVIFCIFLPILPARGDAITCLYTTNPEAFRISLRPTGMTVSWTSDGYLRDDGTPTPTVYYGTDPNNLTNVSTTGFTTNYYQVVGYRKFFHNVFLDGLLPSTQYFYQIPASTRCVLQSDVMTFTTAPVAGSNPNMPINVTVVGDIGMNTLFNISNAQATVLLMNNHIGTTHFLLNVGDLGYADSYPYPSATNQNFSETVWNRFQTSVSPFASAVPYQTVPGNHEVTCDIYGDSYCAENLRNFTIYNSRFCMSGELSGGYRNLWYSFDYGPIHVVMVNTETDFPNAPSGPGTTLNAGGFVGVQPGQIAWLTADLQKATAPAQRAKIPWLIAVGHRAFFGSTFILRNTPTVHATTAQQYCQACKAAFWPLFSQYKVDFYMTGHVHWMELSYPMDINGTVLARDFVSGQGVIHVTDGAGGAPPANEHLDVQDSLRSVWVFSGVGFHRLHVLNSTHAYLHFIDAIAQTVFYSTLVIRSR